MLYIILAFCNRGGQNYEHTLGVRVNYIATLLILALSAVATWQGLLAVGISESGAMWFAFAVGWFGLFIGQVINAKNE